ncbi:MAG: dephospho-CoA kinase [Actinomycetota bacterium]|nr:dephospho-CoA kinase [Actinomycetota bacterium]
MIRAALTGNYGSGKSSVLGFFAELGACCLSADDIVKELLSDPMILQRIHSAFGGAVFEGEQLQKKKLASIIFSDPAGRERLEAILHPPVLEKIDNAIAACKGDVAVVEIPLLFECGYESRFDVAMDVYADNETALARLEKNGIPRQEAAGRLQAQLPALEKARRAGIIINNQGSVKQARWQVGRIYRRLTEAGRERH